jgi:hypothetical protein
MPNSGADRGIHSFAPGVYFGQVEPRASRLSNSGSVTAPIVVVSHGTTVVASQGAMPSILSPSVNIDANIKAPIVTAKPVPPRSRDTYRWGNVKIGKDKIACVTANTNTATTNPVADMETPGTIHPATSSPIAHDARSTTARSDVRLTGVMNDGISSRARLQSLPTRRRSERASSRAVAVRMPRVMRIRITGFLLVFGYAQDRLTGDAF